MPKPYTLPTLYDECKTISITNLRKWGYLKSDNWKTGTITWSRGEGSSKQITGSIGIAIHAYGEHPYVELDYKSNDKPINYHIPLVFMRSNLGKGVVWFFRCPNTGKQCRKLYLVGGYFFHRSAFRGCMYEKQTYSKRNRDQFRAMGKIFGIDEVYDKLYSKNFKNYYRGKPTKRYIKLMKLVNDADGINESNLYLS